MHGNLCGPIVPATPGGRKYFLLLMDDLTRYMWVTFLMSKDQAAEDIKLFQAGAERESNARQTQSLLHRSWRGVYLNGVWLVLGEPRSQTTSSSSLFTTTKWCGGEVESDGGRDGKKLTQSKKVCQVVSWGRQSLRLYTC